MGEVPGVIGAMRGRVPDAGVCRGEAGETDPESEDDDPSETEPERRRPPMGMGSERGAEFSLLDDMVRNGIYSIYEVRWAVQVGTASECY